MRVQPLQDKSTLVTLYNETQILYSYDTPVVVRLPEGTFLRTLQKYSKTTDKHIATYLVGEKAYAVPQSEIDSFVQHI
jgi:hypothetical protein